MNHLVWKRYQSSSGDGSSALFRPLRTRSYCSLAEVDFNLHKSNSTFYADLDISRIELLLLLFKDVITPLSPPSRKPHSERAHKSDEKQTGTLKHLTPALGGVSCIFRREIKPWQRYDVESRILCWDDKWLYIVSHFLKPGMASSEENILASAISKYVFKKGRRTIAPKEVLQFLQLLKDGDDADADADVNSNADAHADAGIGRSEMGPKGGYALLAVLQLTLVGLWAAPSGKTTRATVATAVVSWLASIIFGILSHYEHICTIRPATINCGYLFLSSIMSLAETRTLFFLEKNRSIAVLYTVTLCIKVVLLITETMSKRSLLRRNYKDSPPESTVGILGECLFCWLNPLLMLGNRMDLTVELLPPIEDSLRSTGHGESGLHALWRKRPNRNSPHSLLWACCRYYLVPILLGVFPRALQVAFTFAQPFLVEATTTWVASNELTHPKAQGYALIGAFGIVYTGIAVSTAFAHHQAYRVVSMIRADLVDMLYSHVMVMRDIDVETSAPVTLMSADMERISGGLHYIHDAWACIVEIPIALYLLWRQLGVASIAPIIVVFICMALSLLISGLAGPRQQVWLEAIEKRVDITAKVLGSVKGVRTAGLTDKLFNLVQTMRVEEVVKSEKFRRLLILVVGVAYSNVTLSPLASFTIYALIARHKGNETLTAAKAFTSLTLFTLLATPISNLVEAATGVATAIGSIKRVNEFLQSDPRRDDAHEPRGTRSNISIPASVLSSALTEIGVVYDGKGMSVVEGVPSISSREKLPLYYEVTGPVFVAEGRSAGWEEGKPAVVHDLTFEIHRGTVTFVVGPVGSGKSTFVRALLRETPIFSGGLKADPDSIAYCSQTPWLTNNTIQENILGESLFDLRWYNTVIEACALHDDIRKQPNRDKTMLGTQGAILSGGQKQRVALARAVYSRTETIILDDVFSGLDRTTEDAVFNALLAPGGLLRKLGTTVIMTTNSPIWVEKWASSNVDHPNERLGYWLGIYAFIAVMATSTLVTSCCAPMSFFQTTDLGNTTNRFSQDLQLIDMELPLSVLNTILTFFTCVAQMVVICTATGYIAATIPACIIAFYFTQRFYLRTSRQIRYLDIEAKAPLVSHFLESLSGLSTIRSYKWEHHYRRRNSKLLNDSQKPFYLLFAIQRWLELVIALMVAGFAVVLVSIAVATRGKVSASFIGLALLNIVTFTENLQGLIKQWTVLETSIGAVARIRNFKSTIESEHLEDETAVPPPDWPAQGAIEFSNVVASYKNSWTRALDNISLSIKPGTKVGICGRSGSGKSSLVSSLFRLIELTSGTINIDGLDISLLGRNHLRAQLNCIPQEPFILPGCSVRLNVDPGISIHDDIIIDALKKVQLWDAVRGLGGLDATISPDTFSPGQKQLLCFARAMVRPEGKILVLDEATSSIDTKTDDLIQSLIRSEFADHTVIAIAHRLETIVDFDEIIVVDAGRVEEQGPPAVLLERGGAFAELYWDKDRSSDRTPLRL
ncbi:hypothetical protein BDV27DRAFT_168126 [Aspergillus caelatus]|uniref:P-loop containing nucleoside triphosphate hydrolase protein n=1 Tax=Aspergillus caelatus TaxID=61420 RepID=A0A5N7AH22_9EURO|nr:uncharacterized protein BDV27DRAFT_168126 [Aspergillus caelatus]KAE8368379.1 hypothetical protein BDV27DRAFT_168126 [Aspergillus caelatus]